MVGKYYVKNSLVVLIVVVDFGVDFVRVGLVLDIMWVLKGCGEVM